MTEVELTSHTYPLDPAGQQELIELWRSEWTRTDYDWLAALNGDWADTLQTTTVMARIDGRAVASATVNFARQSSETCLVGNVVTLAEWRGRGLAKTVTDAAVALGFEAGCTMAFLGSSRRNGNVYERCGFTRLAGSIMSRAASPDLDANVGFSPGQAVEVRDAVWGDMPGFVRLLTQPVADSVIDYPRGLVAMAHADPLRCVSAFAVVREEVDREGGAMLVLAARGGHRIFGLATLTPGPGPGRRHRAIVDVAVHANYATSRADLASRLLDEAARRKLQLLEARVGAGDSGKLDVLARAGFQVVGTLRGHLRLRAGDADVMQLEMRL
ncbi:MAG: GNAT family N-acetyltransferase [Devosia sp.]